MSNAIVLYRSKSGFTKKYAQWIASATGAKLSDARYIKPADLDGYDTIVFGGGLYVGGINGLSLITKNLERLKGKKLIVFTQGATPVRPDIFEEVKNQNLTAEQLKYIEFFMLRGGFDYSKLTVIDKLLMILMKIKLKSRKKPNADERGLLAAYTHPVDFTNERHIASIVEAINR